MEVSPRIWYSPSARRWWMEPATVREAALLLGNHEDAINVTNAYALLPAPFIATLRREAGR